MKHEFFLVFSLLRFGVLFSYVLPERNQRLEFEEQFALFGSEDPKELHFPKGSCFGVAFLC